MIRRHLLTIQSITPISHGDTITGVDNQTNIRLFMRSNMLINGKSARVPSISENALRSVMIRSPIHDALIQSLNIGKGELPQSVMNLLFSGGNMAAGSKAPADEISLGYSVKKLYPSIDLLGGAVDGFILPKSRLYLSAWIVSKEYIHAIRHIAPHLQDEASSVSVFDMVDEETRTRGTGSESSGNQMLYTYETLAAGVKILIEFTMDSHTPDVTDSALGYAVNCWDGFIGGQARQGRGRMVVVDNNLPKQDQYLDHIKEYSESMRSGLISGDFGTGRQLCAA